MQPARAVFRPRGSIPRGRDRSAAQGGRVLTVRSAHHRLGDLERLIETTPEPVLIVVLHRRIRDLLDVGDRLAMGQKPAQIVADMKVHPFFAEKLATASRRWTTDELTDAIAGLVRLDSMIKGVPGAKSDELQRRLAFTLWVMDHVGRRERQTA